MTEWGSRPEARTPQAVLLAGHPLTLSKGRDKKPMRGTLILAALALASMTSTLPLCKGRGHDSPCSVAKHSCKRASKVTASCPVSHAAPAPVACPASRETRKVEAERRQLLGDLFPAQSPCEPESPVTDVPTCAPVAQTRAEVKKDQPHACCCCRKGCPVARTARDLSRKLDGLLSSMAERLTDTMKKPRAVLTVELTFSRKVTLVNGKSKESSLVLRMGPGGVLSRAAWNKVKPAPVVEEKISLRMPRADEVPLASRKLVMPRATDVSPAEQALVMPRADEPCTCPLSYELPHMPRADEDPVGEVASADPLGS
jgi:hypothetical protein